MSKTQMREPMLKAKEAAVILDCCPDDVLELRRKGLLMAEVYKRRGWRFRKSEVLRYRKAIERMEARA